MAGIQDIDVNDWKKYTKYRGNYNSNHPVIVNFWKVSLSMPVLHALVTLKYRPQDDMNEFELYG